LKAALAAAAAVAASASVIYEQTGNKLFCGAGMFFFFLVGSLSRGAYERCRHLTFQFFHFFVPPNKCVSAQQQFGGLRKIHLTTEKSNSAIQFT